MKDKLILENAKKISPEIILENPWNYQPYIIGNQIITINSIFKQYIAFVHENFGIVVSEEKSDNILEQIKDDNYYIVAVDELYLKNSKFYKIMHNKHFILIKKVEETKVCYVDSETMCKYVVGKEELEDAVYKNEMDDRTYVIDMHQSFEREFKNQKVEYSSRLPYLETELYTNLGQDEAVLFYLEAIRLSITFQIQPYLRMKIKYCGYRGERLYVLYEQLIKYMLMCRMKKSFNKEIMFNHMHKINLEIDAVTEFCL